MERVSQPLKPFLILLQHDVMLAVVVLNLEDIDTENRIAMKDMRTRDAAVFFLEAATPQIERHVPVHDIGEEGADDGIKNRRVRHGFRVSEGNEEEGACWCCVGVVLWIVCVSVSIGCFCLCFVT